MSKGQVSLRDKDILGLQTMTVPEMELILDTAKEMKNIIDRDIKKVPTLRGKSIINLFFEPSTYKWDRDSFSIQYQKVQDQSVDYILSGIGVAAYPLKDYRQNLWNYGEWYKGFTYDYEHQMSKTTSFHIIYMDLKPGGYNATGGDKELATGVVWKF